MEIAIRSASGLVVPRQKPVADWPFGKIPQWATVCISIHSDLQTKNKNLYL